MRATMQRKLKTFLNRPKEILISMQGFILPLTYIVIIQIVFSKFKLSNDIQNLILG